MGSIENKSRIACDGCAAIYAPVLAERDKLRADLEQAHTENDKLRQLLNDATSQREGYKEKLRAAHNKNTELKAALAEKPVSVDPFLLKTLSGQVERYREALLDIYEIIALLGIEPTEIRTVKRECNSVTEESVEEHVRKSTKCL